MRDLREMKILAVDDDPHSLKLIEAILEANGYKRIQTASSGEEGLDLVKRCPPDLILLDIMLPAMNGYQFCQRVKENEATAHVPVIMVTGGAWDENAVLKESFESGATDFITKPIRPPEFLARVKSALTIKDAYDRVRESETKFRALTESTASAIFIVQGDRFCYANPITMSILEYTEEELFDLPFWEVVHPDMRNLVKHYGLARQRGEGVPSRYEIKILTKTGVTKWLDHTGTRIEYKNQPALLGSAFDITERKHAEEERVRLVTAIEQAAESFLLLDKDRTIQYVNPAFERLTGYSSKEMIRKKSHILRCDQHDEAFYEAIWDSAAKGRVWTGHLFNRKKDGSFYETETTISPVVNSSGHIHNYVLIERDITQETQLKRQLHQSQKMEAIGTLAGGIAHDFNNILTAIIGYTEMVVRGLVEGETAKSYLEHVLKAGNRAKDLVRQILTFSRQNEHERTEVQVASIVKEAMRFFRATLPTTIEIHQSTRQADSSIILANPTQIHQILMNLCSNAAHAMREQGGILEIILAEVDLNAESCQCPGLSPGPYLKLTVRDTGHGMDSKTMERIFEPFFTTKKQGEGTGMGLAAIHEIVKSHGGAITVSSEPNAGSTFNVFFPRLTNRVPEAKQTFKPLPKGNERILLVDDEETITYLGSKILMHLGYEVTTKTSSIEALSVFRSQPDRFDLVITDQTMPQMTGTDLSKELLAIRPRIVIILCTGFSDTITPEEAEKLGIREFIMKPVDFYDLATIVRKLMDEQQKGKD